MPIELFEGKSLETDPVIQKVMDDSIEVVRRHREGGTLHNEHGKIHESIMDELGSVGYWGLLVDKQYGGSGTPFRSFAKFLTRMALEDPTIAGLASVHGCIGAVDPVRTFGNDEQKERFLPDLASGRRLSAFALDGTMCRLGFDRIENHCSLEGRQVHRKRRKVVYHGTSSLVARLGWSA